MMLADSCFSQLRWDALLHAVFVSGRLRGSNTSTRLMMRLLLQGRLQYAHIELHFVQHFVQQEALLGRYHLFKVRVFAYELTIRVWSLIQTFHLGLSPNQTYIKMASYQRSLNA